MNIGDAEGTNVCMMREEVGTQASWRKMGEADYGRLGEKGHMQQKLPKGHIMSPHCHLC